MKKLFIVVRADLPPAQQAVQAIHAARSFVELHPRIEATWFHESNTIALLEVRKLADLLYIRDMALAGDVDMSEFYEPDLQGALTAIAMLGAAAEKLCKGLDRALDGR